MPWLKVDDGEWTAPETVRMGNETYGVYTRLRTYCAQHLTDGLVPAGVVAMVAGEHADEAVQALEDNGLARRVSATVNARRTAGGLLLTRYLDDNPSRAQVDADRQARRDRGRAAAMARWSNGAR